MKKNDDSDVQKPESWRLSCQTIVGNKENSGKDEESSFLLVEELLIYPRICCRTVIRTRKIPGEKVSVVSAELRSV
ncbi:hypothetical protein V6N13_066462 [Hibiscus sabdariffa]|uniref:Uncharacterized protein n=1 Tax=Hibiscus sabdariffa TaxID=183260 RepID=A0ABR2DRH5_9ROSI